MDKTPRRSKRQREMMQIEIENQSVDQLTAVSLRHMEVASLKRYKKVFNVKSRHSRPENTEQLYEAVVRHFSELDVPNQDVTIEAFIYNIKNENQSKNKNS